MREWGEFLAVFESLTDQQRGILFTMIHFGRNTGIKPVRLASATEMDLEDLARELEQMIEVGVAKRMAYVRSTDPMRPWEGDWQDDPEGKYVGLSDESWRYVPVILGDE